MIKNQKGLTLTELFVSLILLTFLTVTMSAVYRSIFVAWRDEGANMDASLLLDMGFQRIERDLREAQAASSPANFDEIRYTDNQGNSYIYYLYNTNDTYGPPVFDQTTYQLRRANLTGGINGTFTYGDGAIIVRDVLPPGGTSSTDLSQLGNLLRIDLEVSASQNVRLRTVIRPRNL